MKKNKLLACFLSIAVLTVTGCKTDTPTPSQQETVDVESVVFVTALTSVQPGTYELEAKTLPANSDQRIRYTLVNLIEGVSLTGSTLTIGLAVEDETIIKVKATSIYDPSKGATLQLTVDNKGAEAVEISTESQLRAIGTEENGLNKSYVLKNDITLTQPWEPIGVAETENEDGSVTPGTYFNGIFDGAGYSIKGINIDKSAAGFNIGFFSQLSYTAIVKNTGFEGSLLARGWSGAITAINAGKIENCISNVSVNVLGGSAGALVSVNRGQLINSYAIGELTSSLPTTEARSAGLVAANEGTIKDCFGDIHKLKYDNYVAFDASKNTDYMLSTADMLKASTFASWSEDVWYLADGFYPLLKHEGFIAPTVKEVSINFTDAATSIDVEQLENMSYTPTVEIINGESTSAVTYALKEEITGVSIALDTGVMTFTTDVVNQSKVTVVATLVGNQNVKSEKTYTVIYNPAPVGDVVEIGTAEALMNLATTTNAEALAKDYKLTADIELTGWYSSTIGTIDNPFTGNFDGQGYTITGLKGGGDPALSTFGLFGVIAADSVVENFALYGNAERNPDLYISSVSGVLAGINYGTLRNIYSNVEIRCVNAWAGGLVGRNAGTMENIISENTITINDSTEIGAAIAIANCTEDETIQGNISNIFVSSAKGSTKAFHVANEQVDSTIIVTEEVLKMAATYASFDPIIWNIVEGQIPTLIKNQTK